MNLQKTSSVVFLILLLSTFIYQACLRKADDDPWISLKSREARLKGEWTVTKYNISGEDMLNNDDTYSDYTYPCGNYTITIKTQNALEFDFDKDGDVKISMNSSFSSTYDYTNNYCNDQTQSDTEKETLLWKWGFLHKGNGKKDKEQIVLNANGYPNYYYYPNYPYYPYYIYEVLPLVYDITKLSNSEMKWEAVFETELIEMEFKKK